MGLQLEGCADAEASCTWRMMGSVMMSWISGSCIAFCCAILRSSSDICPLDICRDARWIEFVWQAHTAVQHQPLSPCAVACCKPSQETVQHSLQATAQDLRNIQTSESAITQIFSS